MMRRVRPRSRHAARRCRRCHSRRRRGPVLRQALVARATADALHERTQERRRGRGWRDRRLLLRNPLRSTCTPREPVARTHASRSAHLPDEHAASPRPPLRPPRQRSRSRQTRDAPRGASTAPDAAVRALPSPGAAARGVRRLRAPRAHVSCGIVTRARMLDTEMAPPRTHTW